MKRLAAIAIIFLFVLSMLPIFVLPAYANPIINSEQTIGCATITCAGTLLISNNLDIQTYAIGIQGGGGGILTPIHVLTITDDHGSTWVKQSQISFIINGAVDCTGGSCMDAEIWSAMMNSGAGTNNHMTVTMSAATSTGPGAGLHATDLTGISSTPVGTATGSCLGAPFACSTTPTAQTSSSNTVQTGVTFELAAIAPGAAFNTGGGGYNAGSGYTIFYSSPSAGGGGEESLIAASPTFYNWTVSLPSLAGPWALAGATFGAAAFLDVTILNMDLSNYLVVPFNKFYNFNETAIGIHGSNVNIVKWKWTDGASTAEVQYSNVTKVATVLQGNNIITIGSPTATSSKVGGQKKLQVIIPVRLSENALDTTGVSINAYSQLADGTTTGYLVVRPKYFNIFNQGGTTSQQMSGLCTLPPTTSGYFSALCQDKGWIMTNTTWFQLQSYHTEFAINLNDAGGTPDTFLFQDFANSNAGAEDYTATGDWKIDIGWFYFSGGVWIKAFHMLLQMQQGNQGVQDQWTQINATFYNGKNTKLSSQLFAAWIEQSPRSQIRLFVDLWISKLNSSSLHAARAGAYYYAIHQSGFTFFGSWSPFLQNASSSIAFAKNIGNSGQQIDVQAIQFHKLYWNISRGHHPIGQTNFQIFARDFNLEQFKTTKGRMEGVDTPIFVDAKIPTLPVDGFLAPLYAAIASIGDLIWSALAAAFSAIWISIGSRFPWFTAFWDGVGANVTGFANLFVSVLSYLGGFLSFLFSIFSFVTAPIQIVINTWTFLSNAFNTVFPGASLSQWATIFIIFVFGFSLLEALEKNDWPWIIRFTRQVWGIVSAIMFYTFKFARLLIDAILAIIP